MNNQLDVNELRVDRHLIVTRGGRRDHKSFYPVTQGWQKYPRIVVEILNSSADATADEEEFLDLSLNSLKTECKRMKLSESYTSFETVESRQYPHWESSEKIIAHSPESPDESMSSDIFVVEASANDEKSITSSKVAEYLEIVRQEDSSSYFNTPPGTPRKISFRTTSPLNDLEERRSTNVTAELGMRLPTLLPMPRHPGKNVLPRSVALSQPAPGLGCTCRRIAIGRGHGCNLRFPRW